MTLSVNSIISVNVLLQFGPSKTDLTKLKAEIRVKKKKNMPVLPFQRYSGAGTYFKKFIPEMET
jgi:hypothetical protein